MTEHPTQIDEVIDRAVREMMRRDPPPGFRDRVLSRLDAPAGVPLFWRGFATAAVALAAVAIAFFALREPPTRAPGRDAQVAAAPTAPTAEGVRPQASVAVPTPGRPARRAPRPEAIRTATFGPRDGRISAANLPTGRTTQPPARAGALIAAPPGAPAAPPAAAEPTATAMPGGIPPSVPPIVVPTLTFPAPLDVPPIVVPPIQIVPLPGKR